MFADPPQAGFLGASGGEQLRFGGQPPFRKGFEDLVQGAARAVEGVAVAPCEADGEGRYLGVGMRRAVELVAGGARAAGDAAAERRGEAIDVCPFLGPEGVYVYAVVGCGGGISSHGDMVGRGVAGVQRARVTIRIADKDGAGWGMGGGPVDGQET